MGEMVRFASNGSTCDGYLAGDAGPGIVVIQEWWGLVDHIKDVCDRFASEGFVALAPDLYHGKTTTEPDEAGKLLMAMEIEKAARDMSGAFDFLVKLDRVTTRKIGTVGFCAGGNLALLLSTKQPVTAAVGFYPYPRAQVDLTHTNAAIMVHIAEHDEAPSPEMGRQLIEQARSAGKEAELHVYPGTEHAFFNDARPEVYHPEAAGQAWERTLEFFRRHLT